MNCYQQAIEEETGHTVDAADLAVRAWGNPFNEWMFTLAKELQQRGLYPDGTPPDLCLRIHRAKARLLDRNSSLLALRTPWVQCLQQQQSNGVTVALMSACSLRSIQVYHRVLDGAGVQVPRVFFGCPKLSRVWWEQLSSPLTARERQRVLVVDDSPGVVQHAITRGYVGQLAV